MRLSDCLVRKSLINSAFALHAPFLRGALAPALFGDAPVALFDVRQNNQYRYGGDSQHGEYHEKRRKRF